MDEKNDAKNAQKPPVTISPAHAELLLRRNLANLANKVKDGKTLSSKELALLESALAGESAPTATEYADTQDELAKILGVSRKTIGRWRKIEGNPGAQPDGRLHVPSWRAFKATRPSGELDDCDAATASQAKAQQILLQNEKLKVQIAILRKLYMPCAEVERIGGELGASIRKIVSTIHLAAPSVVGVSVAEAENILKRIEDEVLSQLHQLDTGVSQWQASHEPVD